MDFSIFFEESAAPFGAPQFDKFKNEYYKPAFEWAVSRAKEEVDAIISNVETPTFENTILALEHSGRDLATVSALFFNLNEACTDDQMQQIAEEVSPLLTEFSMYTLLNQALFNRIKYLYERKESLDLSPEDARLLSETYLSYFRNGAALPEGKKEEFAKIQEELALLNLKFGKNVLSATNAFRLNITDEADLDGIPDSIREMAAYEAAQNGESGWTFTLDHPSLAPFLKYSSKRDLREKIWRASSGRCVGGDFDNRQNIVEIVKLRRKEAELLGYETYADYALSDRMAKNRQTVDDFLDNLIDKSLPFAKKDVETIKQYALHHGATEQLMPWDFSYWCEKYKADFYSINEEEYKPYFELGSVRDAVLGLATTLYGISFTKRNDIPLYHPDVVTYEVRDGERFMGLLYLDFFPRSSKRGGAWMTSFRESGFFNGNEERPFVSIVTNFSKPTAETPSLLTFDELTTLLHEFGHALHGLLAEGKHPTLTGTNVARDFVELPSQIMENWGYEPDFLQSFAKDYRTGSVIPKEMIDKLIAAKNFLAGYASLRQLQFGKIDMAWHTNLDIDEINVVEFEQKTLAHLAVLPQIASVAMSPAFSHIFAGGYAAGYYSYKWAEVLDADAFSLFKEKGIFNRKVADAFRKKILSRGNIADADTLYRDFRGREPQVEALLERSGMN
ncbi:MAG: M3 family metallopeptidase [Bacteroidales bacterium]|nr:M3 family metallopeptidase [Bacteroidales bacterium]